MLKFIVFLFLALVLGFTIGLALSPGARRSAAHILAERDAVKLPGGFLDDAGVKELERCCRRRCDLARELMDAWPGHVRVPEVAAERWAFLGNTFAEHDTVLEEIEHLLADSPSKALELRAKRARAWSGLHSERIGLAECLGFVDGARAAGADDEWTATMLLYAAQERTADPDEQRRLCTRVHDELPRAIVMKRDVGVWERLLSHVGAPFELDFVDLATSRLASIIEWRGKPILIHARRAHDWAPLPENALREIEDRHRDIGLVAVQLMMGEPGSPADRPDRQIIAPDDDPMNSWEMRYGIRKTPMFLVVDAQGRLRSVSQSFATSERWLSASIQ